MATPRQSGRDTVLRSGSKRPQRSASAGSSADNGGDGGGAAAASGRRRRAGGASDEHGGFRFTRKRSASGSAGGSGPAGSHEGGGSASAAAPAASAGAPAATPSPPKTTTRRTRASGARDEEQGGEPVRSALRQPGSSNRGTARKKRVRLADDADDAVGGASAARARQRPRASPHDEPQQTRQSPEQPSHSATAHASIPVDLPQEVRLLKLCERLLGAEYENVQRELIADAAADSSSSSLSSSSRGAFGNDESRRMIGIVQDAMTSFLRGVESEFVEPARRGDRDHAEARGFAEANTAPRKRRRANPRNAEMQRAATALENLEREYRSELESWDAVREDIHSSRSRGRGGGGGGHHGHGNDDEAAADSGEWDVDDIVWGGEGGGGGGHGRALGYDGREFAHAERRAVETLLLQMDELQHSIKVLNTRYAEADAFCVDTAKRMNAVAFDGYPEVGETRALLKDVRHVDVDEVIG